LHCKIDIIIITFAFLPNYFKKIGIVCFLASIAIMVTATQITSAEVLSVYDQGNDNISFSSAYEMAQEFSPKYLDYQVKQHFTYAFYGGIYACKRKNRR
jgi:hypothetical protein